MTGARLPICCRPMRMAASAPDGREYVIVLDAADATPAPWVNVLANAHLGTVVSEAAAPTPGPKTPMSFA